MSYHLSQMKSIVTHIYRLRNQTEDKLASYRVHSSQNLWWHFSLDFISALVAQDMSFTPFYRFRLLYVLYPLSIFLTMLLAKSNKAHIRSGLFFHLGCNLVLFFYFFFIFIVSLTFLYLFFLNKFFGL